MTEKISPFEIPQTPFSSHEEEIMYLKEQIKKDEVVLSIKLHNQ